VESLLSLQLLSEVLVELEEWEEQALQGDSLPTILRQELLLILMPLALSLLWLEVVGLVGLEELAVMHQRARVMEEEERSEEREERGEQALRGDL